MQNREQPWSRRPDWTAGRIEYSSKGSMVGVWLMALLVLLMSSPLLYRLREEILEKKNYPALAGLVFPVLGIGLLIHAIRLTIRWLRFGKSVLELSRVPGVIGGTVAGIIHTSLNRETVEGIRMSLRSINRSVRRKHRKRDVRERIVWEEHLPISRERLSVGMMGAAVPFSFHVHSIVKKRPMKSPTIASSGFSRSGERSRCGLPSGVRASGLPYRRKLTRASSVAARTESGAQRARESCRPIQDSSPNDAIRRHGVLFSCRPESICCGIAQRLSADLGRRYLVPSSPWGTDVFSHRVQHLWCVDIVVRPGSMVRVDSGSHGRRPGARQKRRSRPG